MISFISGSTKDSVPAGGSASQYALCNSLKALESVATNLYLDLDVFLNDLFNAFANLFKDSISHAISPPLETNPSTSPFLPATIEGTKLPSISTVKIKASILFSSAASKAEVKLSIVV